MRFYAIAMFILLFNGSIYLFNSMGNAYGIDALKTPMMPTMNISSYNEQKFNETLGKLVPTQQSNILSDMFNMVNFIITTAGQIVSLIISSTIGFPFMLYNQFHLPAPLCVVVGFAMFITYIAGVIDFLRGGDSLGS